MDVLLLADCLIYYTDLFYADRLKYHMKISLRKSVIVLLLIFILVAASSWAVQFYYLTYLKKEPNTWEYGESPEDYNKKKYIKANEEYASCEWLSLDGSWYYFGADEYAVTGLQEINGSTFKFTNSGTLETGWVDITSHSEMTDSDSISSKKPHREYVTDDHTLLTGWQEIDGSKYYFDTKGEMATGNVTLDETFDGEKLSHDTTFVFDNDGKLLSGWQTNAKGRKFYVNQDGTIASGEMTIDDKWYNLEDNGVPKTGWINISGDRYYYDSEGAAASGTTKLGNSYYTFALDGKLITEDFLLDQLDELQTMEEGNYANQYKNSEEPEIVGIGGYTPDSSDISRLTNIIEDMPNCRTCGFVMINLYNGQGIAYNYDKTVYSASCIKGPYIASLISYKPELIETRSNALIAIVRDSDNDIYSNTRKSYGREFFGDWCEASHVTRDASIYHYPQLSAINLAKLWVHTYYFMNTDEAGREIRDWYTTPIAGSIYTTLGTYSQNNASTDSSSDKAKSLGYRTESKAGWICEGKYRATTDGGIIYPDDSAPYIISIITDMPSDMDSLDPLTLELNNIYTKTK